MLRSLEKNVELGLFSVSLTVVGPGGLEGLLREARLRRHGGRRAPVLL